MTAAPLSSESPARTVLVIEDDADSRFLYAESIALLGWRTWDFPTRESALAALIADPRPVALVLLDLSLPGMTAAEFVARLRDLPDRAATPLLVLSARMDIEEQARRLRADGMLRKPCDLDPLLREIQRLAGAGASP